MTKLEMNILCAIEDVETGKKVSIKFFDEGKEFLVGKTVASINLWWGKEKVVSLPVDTYSALIVKMFVDYIKFNF